MSEKRTQYDLMREADKIEEDAFFPEEISDGYAKSDKERYFEYYDDVKTSIKEDW